MEKDTVRGWTKVFRDPPFYLVGVLPLGLGTLLAVRDGHELVWAVWALGSVAVALVMAGLNVLSEAGAVRGLTVRYVLPCYFFAAASLAVLALHPHQYRLEVAAAR